MNRHKSLVFLVLLLLAQFVVFRGAALAEDAKPAATTEKTATGTNKTTAAAKDDDYYELYQLFADTMDQVDRNYVKKVDRRELFEAAIRGMMTKLDPYSAYIGPDELSQFRTPSTTSLAESASTSPSTTAT